MSNAIEIEMHLTQIAANSMEIYSHHVPGEKCMIST
jgi:hypothetical protein